MEVNITMKLTRSSFYDLGSENLFVFLFSRRGSVLHFQVFTEPL